MVLRVAATICLFITIIILAACPFFRRSRRGIFITHWIFIHWLLSSNWDSFKHVHYESNYFLLLPIATVLLAGDQIFKQQLEDKLLCLWDAFLITMLLIAIDAAAILLIFSFKYEAALTTLFIMIFVFVLLATHNEKSAFEHNFKYLMKDSTNSLFNDYNASFNCFGKLGCIFYISIICNLLREIVPYLQFHAAFTYFIYFFLTIGTLSFLTIPAYVGGLIQTTKIVGALIAEYGDQKKRLDPLLV